MMDEDTPSSLPRIRMSRNSLPAGNKKTPSRIFHSGRRSISGRASISGRSSVSGRSSQYFQVISKTPYHVVESFGVAMPVLVIEALTFSDRSATVSACISADGWAWFVCGRKLLVWKYKLENVSNKGVHSVFTNLCYELTLPPSDLAHKAELVSVFIRGECSVPSCIAVSPEGTVCYWPSVVHQNSVETNADLLGQECHSLSHLGSAGCILATTTSTLLLVEPQITKNGRHAVACRAFSLPHGFLGLGGLGRRMSSLIFGSLPSSQVMENRLVKVVTTKLRCIGPDQWSLYVLSERRLQKWFLCAEEKERLVYECKLKRLVRDSFQETVVEAATDSPCDLDIWMMDMQPTEGGVMILTAAAKSQFAAQVYYALGKLETVDSIPPTKFTSFCPLNLKPVFRHESDSEIQIYRFLLIGQAAYLFNDHAVSALSATAVNANPDVIEFLGSDDQLLGGSVCGKIPVFFSKQHGLVSISPSDISSHDLPTSLSMSDVPSTSDCTISQLSEYGINIAITEAELHQYTYHTDIMTRLKAAFIHFAKSTREPVMSRKILDEIFPFNSSTSHEINSLVDVSVVRLGKLLIDDVPVGDPRWKQNRESDFGYASLQISTQLEDKFRALELFYMFLKSMKVWDQLGAVIEKPGPVPTTYVLCELAEKLIATLSILKLDDEYAELRDTVMKNVIKRRDEVTGSLGVQDLFYRQVSEVQDFFLEIVELANTTAVNQGSPPSAVDQLKIINGIVLSVLQDVVRYRQQKAEFFMPVSHVDFEVCVYAPWTVASGPAGLKDSLVSLVELSVKHCVHLCGDTLQRNEIFEQVVNLIDLILDGRKCQVESLRESKKFDSALLMYQKERFQIIKPLVDEEQYERAATLAEKYCDFEILILICEASGFTDRIDMYMKKFASQGFSKYFFNHHIRENKHGQLMQFYLNKPRSPEQQEEFAQFLKDHPSLSWMHDVHRGQFKQAGDTLEELLHHETQFVQRKKLQTCLSKLALLAADLNALIIEGNITHLNAELDLMSYQENLPDAVLVAYGYDSSRLPVLSPMEIIKLYICDEYHDSTEEDFKKALDVLPYVDDEIDRTELRHSIWCQAILKDKWDDLSTDTPKESIKKTTFFKLVDLLFFYDYKPEEFLPPVDRLLESPELGQLCESDKFQFLLRLAYECIEQAGKD